MDDPFRIRLEQRRRALEEGLDLLGWSFDPLDAAVAHVSIARLGAIVERYVPEDDRLMAEWWIRRPHVERRLSSAGKLTLRERDAAEAPVIRKVEHSLWKEEDTPRSASGQPVTDGPPRRVWVEIPLKRDEAWREFTREVFVRHFANDYRVVDFVTDNPNGVGRYLLALTDDSTPINSQLPIG